jgi:hypothetical protein
MQHKRFRINATLILDVEKIIRASSEQEAYEKANALSPEVLTDIILGEKIEDIEVSEVIDE